MKMFFSCLISGGIILSLASCGGNKAKEENQSSENAVAEKLPVYLEGMYATSSRLPLDQYSLEHVFDGKPDTYWATALGAAADEGVMLYFEEKIYAREIKLTPAVGSDLASIKRVSVYADGQKITSGDPMSKISINTDLNSLFIKIDETDHSDVVVMPDDDEQSLEKFDDKFSVGLSEIEVYDRDGKMMLVTPEIVAGSVVASSVLSPADAYSPSQLFDSRKEFVWAEGSKGNGENENLTFTFDKDQTISIIKIWNGYQRSDKHFRSNARIKSFEFGIKNGKKNRYMLHDSMDPQEVKLNESLKGKEFILTILEVYPGTDYKDLVVSEIHFFDNKRPIYIKDHSAEEAAKSLIAKTKGSVLENYVDKRLMNHIDNGDFASDRSLILRSDRTFVLYEHTYSNDGAIEERKETVADGNWEIVEQSNQLAKVRIFGKIYNLSEAAELYKGNTSKEFIKIFQDNLHITPEAVKGEKYVDALFNKP